MTYRALIPVKTLHEAKSRLASHLTHEQRAHLVMEMLHHVLQTLQASGTLETISVVSSDPIVLEQAQLWGARPLQEEAQGHNPALHAAAVQELRAGATALLTISADLPCLRPIDIQTMIEYSYEYPVVLAPAREGTGTNALLVRPPLAVPYVFGPNSLQDYLRQARQRDLDSRLYHSKNIALDIDTIEDLETLHRIRRGSGVLGGVVN